MAIKKSELYSSLWASCDELRGGMDASQYKDYVLVLLFVKYVSDKYAGVPYAPITIPDGASFKDMVALKGKSDIGDQINKKIIGPLANANKLSDMPDFNDPGKLGSGQEIVDRLTNLISIFENKSLDFSKNRADGDDILGDAYEYLMRHFAAESGKSKGQFYTPSEVSRVIAKVIGISPMNSVAGTTAYDPTCGSGSLLLKVAAEESDGAKLHIFCTRKYLENRIMPILSAGLAASGRAREDFEISGGGFVVTGKDDAAVAELLEYVRYRVAFYGSTPAYLPTLACHGWDAVHQELNRLSKEGRWDDMTGLISDEMLNELAVVGERHEIPQKLKDRLDGIADSVSITHNRYPDPHQWADVVQAMK